MDRLSFLIDEFWKWANIPYEKQKLYDVAQLSTSPVEFPRLGELCDACIALINKPLSELQISQFLLGLAIDAEDEDILDKCKKLASESFLYQIASAGVFFPQSETRWQIAELLRREIQNRDTLLNMLRLDSNAYVRKRADNVFCAINKVCNDSM